MNRRNSLWWGTGNLVTMLDLDAFELVLVPPVIQLSNIYVNQENIESMKIIECEAVRTDQEQAVDTKSNTKPL